MPFDARAYAAEAAAEYPPYEFTDMDGETRELPNPGTLSAEQAARLESLSDVDEDTISLSDLFELLDELDADASKAIQAMPIHVAGKLLEEWQEQVDDLGKSDSPSPPPNRAARRSKRTSSSAASKPKRSGSTK